jgi:hypothetical protein
MHQNTTLLTKQAAHQMIHICQNDMIYITWRHATIRLNVTGLMYLQRYLDDSLPLSQIPSCFEITGSPDDGYRLWIQDVGLKLSLDGYRDFKCLLDDSLHQLRQRNESLTEQSLTEDLVFTVEVEAVSTLFSTN